ncbi:hypothetical protein [Ruegeria sp. HKCCD6119]|uniref:hypothetical protein n=1 Tax=Ruegeria sp. HKCCD6119 TaxID=2683003 RepID=UPI001492E064|nr:hypothetical protein [Ruegeria sp. HKCCD6119]NOD85558.1 hypothetical protein [Ruegeria sp. HKCCD6119]
MDIHTQSELILREAGYETWTWPGAQPATTCFENQSIVGFVHVFETAKELLSDWQSKQDQVLARHAIALRSAGAKAWNVYSVFLTAEHAPDLRRSVEKLEEDFSMTRKIARHSVQTVDDLENALMPLAPLRARPVISNADLDERVRKRSKDISPEALEGFLGSASPAEVAELLRSKR